MKDDKLTQLYKKKAIRYDVVFDELVRQIAVHSKELARLVGKVSCKDTTEI